MLAWREFYSEVSTYTPTISISPLSSSSPTSLCTGNIPDWVDGEGDGCDWYEWNDVPGCEVIVDNTTVPGGVHKSSTWALNLSIVERQLVLILFKTTVPYTSRCMVQWYYQLS
jgi:hypothetical protein